MIMILKLEVMVDYSNNYYIYTWSTTLIWILPVLLYSNILPSFNVNIYPTFSADNV